MKRIFLLSLMLIAALSSVSHSEDQSFRSYCSQALKQTGKCPENICLTKCIGGINVEGCPIVCEPVPCFTISAKACPNDFCVLMDGCSGQKVCYEKMSKPGGECGSLADSSQAYECCAGLEKRCGLEFFDGSCDMEAHKSVYSVPICVPCGNKICDQLENSCNCPEDCPPAPDAKAIKENVDPNVPDLNEQEAEE